MLEQLPEILFKGLSTAESLRLHALIHGQWRDYCAGTFLWHQGVERPRAAILLQGELRMTQMLDSTGREIVLQTFSSGALIGVNHLLRTTEVATLSATTLCPSQLYFFDIDLALTQPALARNLLAALADRAALLLQHLTLLNITPLRARILAYLQTLPSAEIPLSRQELANYLVANRSALSRALNALVKEGKLHLSGTHFQLL